MASPKAPDRRPHAGTMPHTSDHDPAQIPTSAEVVPQGAAMSVHELREAAMSVPLPHDRNPALVYLARLGGETSGPTMARVLRRVSATLSRWAGIPADPWHAVPWAALRYQHVAALRAGWQRQGLHARTIAQYLAAVRGVVDEAENLGLLPPDEARKVRKVRGPRLHADEDPAGRAVSLEELAVLFAVCSAETLRGRRDRALLALLFGGGLRRREAARLRVEDFDASRGELRVVGKGRKARRVPLSADAAAVVAAWCQRHPIGVDGPLLVAVCLRDDTTPRDPPGLSPSGVWSVLRDIARRAGVVDITPHDGRRTRITRLLLAGEALPLVQRIAGHASISTTGRYARTDAELALQAARRVPMVPE